MITLGKLDPLIKITDAELREILFINLLGMKDIEAVLMNDKDIKDKVKLTITGTKK